MTVRSLARLGSLLAAASALAGCISLNGIIQPGSESTGRVYDYTAIGASDAVGVGSSRPCQTATVVVGSDSEQLPSPPSCPNGKGYPPDIVGLLTAGSSTVQLTDLGISGAAIGPTERTLGNTWEPFVFGCANPCIPGDFLTDELPLIPSGHNTVTIFAGGNDTNAIFAHVAVACAECTPQQIQAMIGTDITNFGLDYETLVGTIHQLFPFARIYLANLPNFGLIPIGVCTGADPASPPPFCSPTDPAQGNPAAEALLDAISTAIDADVINAFAASGVPVIDLECDKRSYDPNNFSPDGFHPDDAGYAVLAGRYASAIRNFGAPPPAGSCQFSQAGTRLVAPRHLRMRPIRL